jgi:probable F420-dependent oxidoreductase
MLARNMTRYGMTVGGPLNVLGAAARRAEEAGFDSLWVAETARSAFIQAGVALQATSKARVGTAIALAFPRSPVITAMEARDLAELSGGRFALGLGTQVKRVNENRFSTPFEHPAPKMREAIEVIRAVWNSFSGEPINHRGRFYTVTMTPMPGGSPAPGPIPVGVAGVNKGMATLAGEVCDEFLGHPFSSVRYFTEHVRPALDEGLARGGRKPSELFVTQGAITAVASRTEDALKAVKAQIAFYGTTRTYAPVFEAHGWGGTTDALREAHARGDLAGMIACITDEMAETYAVFGTPAEARDRAKRWEGLVDEITLGAPWSSPDHTRTMESFEAIAETFGRSTSA